MNSKHLEGILRLKTPNKSIWKEKLEQYMLIPLMSNWTRMYHDPYNSM
jgi:hypothetical protein